MKRLQRLLKKRSSGGFTLVEMVVSVALLAILMAGMMIFINPIIRSFNDDKTDLTAENVATAVEEYINRSVRNANQVAVFSYVSESDLSGSGCQAIISEMVKFCTNANKDGSGSMLADGKEKYLLKCISLRYDSSTGQYFLCNETVNKTNGSLTAVSLDSKKVFSDCLYKDLYLTVDISKTLNDDFGSTEDEIYNSGDKYRADALNIKICAYRDKERRSKAFEGSGVSELRAIKGMLTEDKTNNEKYYYLKMLPENPNPVDDTMLSFESASEGQRDIFIYYVVRRLAPTGTT
ncbi:MAG: type II secretion system protein [Oscillospiraceae bacterium]